MLRNYTNVAPPVQFTADVAPSDELWPVTSTNGYPDAPFTLGAERGTANEEFVLCLEKTSDSFTVSRGYDGTNPAEHVAGTSIEHCSGAIDFREANSHINDLSIHTTVCTSTTRPNTPVIGQKIYETDTARKYTWTGLGNASTGWLPDAGSLLYYGFWASPTALQTSDTVHGIGHDLPIVANWVMPAMPRLGGAGGVPGVGFYSHRVKIEFFSRAFDYGGGGPVPMGMLAMLQPASPLSFGGSFEQASVVAVYQPGVQNFIYVSAMVDNDRIPAGPAGAKVSLYSPAGQTAADAIYWDTPMWMAVTMV